MLVFLISCANEKMRSRIHHAKIAGYWTRPGYFTRHKEQKHEFASVTCRGTIRYLFESPYAWLVGDDDADGTITKVDDYTLEYRNWTQFKTVLTYHVEPPQKPGHCWKLSLGSGYLYSPGPIDCTKPDEKLGEALNKVWLHYTGEKKMETCEELRDFQ